MFNRFIFISAKLSIFITTLFLLGGCCFDFEDQNSRGIPLSKAMEASASGGGKLLTGQNSESSNPSVEVNASTPLLSKGGGFDLDLVDYGNTTYTWQIPFDISYSVPFNGEIQSLTRLTLTPISVENDHHFVGLFIGGDIVNLQPGSLPDKATDNTWMLEGGIAYRYYFTPAHAFLSPYFSANISYQILTWDYRNSIIADGQNISGDSLSGVGGYMGIGAAIKRNSHLSFFGEVGLGGTVFFPQSNQGFDNDVFSNFGYFNVKAGMTIKF
ncbi:MAG TPA: hypothetical protein VHG71_12940 [Verrucomicrobiae bacterium]|nr:hypothetical protein [Verrucomicrobiae bacterium]